MNKISLSYYRQISMPMLCSATVLLLAWLQPLHVQPWLSWYSESLAYVLYLSLALVANVASFKVGMRTLKLDGMEKIMLGLTGLKMVQSVCIK